MAKYIEVKVIKPYYDLGLEREIPITTKLILNEKRTRELNNKNIIKIVKILRDRSV